MIRPAVTIALAVLSSAALGQDIFVPPVTTGSPGYLFPNSPSDLDRYVSEPEPETIDEGTTPEQVECDVGMISDADWAEMRAEHAKRLERDGAEAAQQWANEMSEMWFDRLIAEGLCNV